MLEVDSGEGFVLLFVRLFIKKYNEDVHVVSLDTNQLIVTLGKTSFATAEKDVSPLHALLRSHANHARIFLLGHYLSPKSSRYTNYSLLGTDNVCREITKHILKPNGGYCSQCSFITDLVLSNM